jgi:hypothetical protein
LPNRVLLTVFIDDLVRFGIYGWICFMVAFLIAIFEVTVDFFILKELQY